MVEFVIWSTVERWKTGISQARELRCCMLEIGFIVGGVFWIFNWGEISREEREEKQSFGDEEGLIHSLTVNRYSE